MHRTTRGMFAAALSATALTFIAGSWPLLAQESKQAKAQLQGKGPEEAGGPVSAVSP